MTKKRRLLFVGAAVILGFLTALSALHLFPLDILSVHQKPGQAPQKVYEYYIIADEKTDNIIMYVPLVVSVGDEVITEDNKRYEIVKIVENRAYARFIEDLTTPQP